MDRLSILEAALQHISFQQTDIQALEPLLGNVDSVLKFDSIYGTFRKKIGILAQTCGSTHEHATSIQEKASLFLDTADGSMKDVVRRRERELKGLEAKAVQIESGYGQLQKEAQVVTQRMQAETKAECERFTSAFDLQLRAEEQLVIAELDKEKTRTKQEIDELRKLIQLGKEENTEFTQKSEDLIKEFPTVPVRSDAGKIEEGKRRILTEIEGRISSGMSGIKRGLDEQLTALSVKHHSELMDIVSEVQELKRTVQTSLFDEVSDGKTRASVQLKRANSSIESLLNDMGPYLSVILTGIEVTLVPLETINKKVTEIGLTEEGISLAKEVGKGLERVTPVLKLAEDHFSLSLTRLEAVLASASAIVSASKATISPAILDIYTRLQKEVSRM